MLLRLYCLISGWKKISFKNINAMFTVKTCIFINETKKSWFQTQSEFQGNWAGKETQCRLCLFSLHTMQCFLDVWPLLPFVYFAGT